MARKITTAVVAAFLKGKAFRCDNTSVQVRPFQADKEDSVILVLFGNPIARYKVDDRVLYVCDGNHQTVTTRPRPPKTATTKDRLNGLPGVSVHQKAGQWYLNGEKWDGYWTKIESLQ